MNRGIQTRQGKHFKAARCRRKAYCNGGRWELNLYDEIADAMKEGAASCDVKLRWGAAWTIDDIGAFEGTAENAMNSYIDTRRSQSRRPFIDAPHFELML